MNASLSISLVCSKQSSKVFAKNPSVGELGEYVLAHDLHYSFRIYCS